MVPYSPIPYSPTVRQKRVRQLLLDALHLWRVKQYDCTAIAHVLDFVQGKIEKFEDNVGDIEGAAAGAIWSSIKQAVNDMLHSAEENAQSAERAFPAAKAVGPRNRLERQSGIQGISWLRFGWSVSWRDGKLKRIFFSVSKFVKQGLSEEAAVTAALEEAKTFREELVHQGKLQPSKPSKSFSSSVRGVWFSNWHQKWRVLFPDPAGKGQRISGGYFGTKEQAEAKAREMARQFGVPAETEVVPARKLSDLPYFEPLGAQKGVRWNLGEQCWHATFLCRTSKKTKNMRFRPKDLSQHEVAKMWKQAVAWRQQQFQEQERDSRKCYLNWPFCRLSTCIARLISFMACSRYSKSLSLSLKPSTLNPVLRCVSRTLSSRPSAHEALRRRRADSF